MLINVLGISSDLNKLSKILKKKIIFIEDNCRSLGAKFKNKYLGTFGDFGTFFFFILIKLPLVKEEWLYVKIKRIMKFYIV